MSYKLSTSDLDPILAAIEERFEEAKPRPVQVVASKLLLLATFGLVLTYLFYLTGGGALIGLAWIWVGLQIVFALLSWRYLPVVKRQRRIYRDLDLIAPDPTPGIVWKARTASQQALVRGAVGLVLVGIFGAIAINRSNLEVKDLPPLLGMIGLICASAYYVWSDRKIPLETAEKLLLWIKFALLVWLAVLVFLVWQRLPWEDWLGMLLAVLWPSWLLSKSRQVARIQERFAPLARAGGLRDSLRQRRREADDSGSESVILDPDDVAGLAYAESEMIRQDRVDAIFKTRSETLERWAVDMAQGVHDRLRGLGPEERLKIQDTISAMSAAASAQSSESPDPLHSLEVPGTSVRLHYRLDAEARRVTVLELVRLDTDG